MCVPSGLQDGRTDELPSAVTCRIGPAASATCALTSPPITARHHTRKSALIGVRPSGVLAERLEDRSLDQALGDIDLVGVEAHWARDRTDLRRRLFDGRFDALSLQTG